MRPDAKQSEMFSEIDAWRACPRCNSRTIGFRTTTRLYICRRCGHEWPADKKPRRAKRARKT